MTLQEHLDDIARTLASNGAKKTEILLFQLYLVCTAKEGYLGEYAKQAKYEDPFDQVEPVLKDIWPKVDFEVLGHFYDDEELGDLVPDIYHSVFDELLNRTARDGGAEFDHLQPKELSSIIATLCGNPEGKSIYNPYAGVGSYAEVFCAGDNYHGEEYDPLTWAIGVLKAWMEGNLSSNYICGDSLLPGWNTRFDIIVSTPPQGPIPDGSVTYCEHLARSARELLAPGGTLVMVTTMENLIGSRKKALLSTGMVDLVVSLPRGVFYWSDVAPLIVRLRDGHKPEDPVTLVDGTSFSSPGGRRTRIINEIDLLQAITEKNPDVSVSLSTNQILDSQYGLNPSLYLPDKEEYSEDGKKMVSLRNLGSFLKLPICSADVPGTNDVPDSIITVNDLPSSPILIDVKPHPLDKDIRELRILDQPALLIYASQTSVRVGYVHASPDSPVFIQSSIHAFIPDENLISVRYLGLALIKAEITGVGFSVLLGTRDDLLLTRIPFMPKDEQEAIVRNALRTLHVEGASRSTKKPVVALVGSQSSLAVILQKSLKIKESFDTPSGAVDWLKSNQKKIDAIIVCYSDRMTLLEIYDLCKSNIPVFFLTANMHSLEKLVGLEQYLKGHSFVLGSEDDLVKELKEEVGERNTPEWQVRQRFANELAAVESIDHRFPDKGYSAQSIIEDMLLSEESRSDWRNKLRTIRTDCILKPLVDYGFLPAIQSGSFNLGAQIDLLADRCYYVKDQQFRHVLIREVVPADVAEMLRGSKRLLNEGSHTIKSIDWDLQMATLFSIMAAMCHIARMIDEGKFDRLEPEVIRSTYLNTYQDNEYVLGRETVKCRQRQDHSDYFYAGNIHLDDSLCRRLRIKQGDTVDIQAAGTEKNPIITDSVCILFYSKQFYKV